MLVVVGVMHKDDIERILSAYPRIRVVQPSEAADEPDAAAVALETTTEHLFAIANWNLLGVQSHGSKFDEAWIEEVVRDLEQSAPGMETQLLRTRLGQRQRRISIDDALVAYRRIADDAGDERFVWDGIKDRTRLDSVYDPFANLTVAQRASLEIARIHSEVGRNYEAEKIRTELRSELPSEFQRLQLDGYWPRYVTAVREVTPM